jgi:Transglutaminase-like superfamily
MNIYMDTQMLRCGAIAVCGLAVFSTALVAQPPQVAPGGVVDQKPEDPHAHESWEVIYLGGKRIGYSHAKTRQAEVEGRRVISTTSDMQLTFKRLGDTTRINTHQEVAEFPTGELLSFEFEMRNPPKSVSRTVGRVEDRFLRLETQNGDRKNHGSRNWDPKTQSPVFQDRSLRQTPMKPGETRKFNVFLPELDTTSSVKLTADDYRFVKLLDGKLHKLLLIRMTQSVNPTLTTRGYFDANGLLILTETNLLGQQMLTYRVSQAEALKEIAGEELDLIVNTMVSVGPIKNAHRLSKVVYRIRMETDDPGRFLVSGGTQQIKRIDDNTVELTVTKATVPAKASKETVEAEFLKSTRLLQSDDFRVRELAKSGAAGETDPVKVAFRLEKYVNSKLKTKNFSTALASAAEVAASLEGDCTEHAMLLAAMLRARQIPSRVAVGLVYVESVQSFGGHMWTEAFLNGAWIPLDATLGQGGIGGGHIKLAESGMADDSSVLVTAFLPLVEVLGNMKIEALRAE